MTLYLDDHGVPSHTIANGEKVPVPKAGEARFLTEQQLAVRYGELNESETPVTGLTNGELERLAEVSRLRGGVDVWRDWEGCLVVWISDAEVRASTGLECCLCISTGSGIAHYNVNQPRYFAKLAMLLASMRTERRNA